MFKTIVDRDREPPKSKMERCTRLVIHIARRFFGIMTSITAVISKIVAKKRSIIRGPRLRKYLRITWTSRDRIRKCQQRLRSNSTHNSPKVVTIYRTKSHISSLVRLPGRHRLWAWTQAMTRERYRRKPWRISLYNQPMLQAITLRRRLMDRLHPCSSNRRDRRPPSTLPTIKLPW